MCCQFGQHILQIFVDPETVCFCSLYQAVHDGAGFCSADGIYVDPVLPPEGEGTDGTFCGVVVHGDFPIGQEEPEIFLLVQTVLECLAGAASGGNFWKRFFYLCEISVNFWSNLTLTVIFPVFIFGFIVKPVQVEQLGDQLHTLCGNGPFNLSGTHHPVGHGVCPEIYAAVFVAAGHLVHLIHLFRLTAEGMMSGRTEST